MDIVIKRSKKISQNVILIFFLFSLSYAICLWPYNATPNEPNNIKYVTIDIVYPYIPIFSAPKTLDTYGVVIIGKIIDNN